MTAQESFATLMRLHVAPALRDLGFKGSGAVFNLPEAGFWASVGFQRSVYSDRDEVRFTANLTVVSRSVWQAIRAEKPYLPERPAPNTFYGRSVWQERIGGLLPGGEDKWWHLGPDTDLEALARDVVAAISDFGLPAMRARILSGDISGH